MLQELGKPLLSECWLESLNQTVKVWCLSTWLLCHFRNEKEATMEDKRTRECVKNPSKLLSRRTLLLTTIFFIGSKFIPSSPTSPLPPPPPPAMFWPPKNFAQNSTLFWVEGEGSLVLLISLERSQHFWPPLWSRNVCRKCLWDCYYGLALVTVTESKLDPVFFLLLKWRIPANCSYYEHRVWALRSESPL